MPDNHQYSIVAKDVAAHVFEVRLTVAKPDPAGQCFAIPAWIPGSYMIRDYARNVIAARAESAGREVRLHKTDKSTWKAEPVDRGITLVLEVFAYDDSVRGAHLDTTHAYFNGPCVFPVVVGQENIACELDIQPLDESFAAGWRVATSMRRNGAEPYGFGAYVAADYAELIDHPVEIGTLSIGEYSVNGIPHGIAIRGRSNCDMGRLCRDLTTLCEQHHAFLGTPAGLDRYLFLLHAPGKGYGGLEHRWSSSLVCARDCLPTKDDDKVDEGYRTFLGLASHEYFHLWNVKRLKPAEFSPYRLEDESYTRLLWVFEGITSYYDDLTLFRSGLITESSYLELLGRTITRVQRTPGRTRQSVAESSFDAWTKFYKQDANATNAIISYYAKGALIALALDLKLRAETNSECSLDDVMKACWEKWGEGDEGMPEDGFESLAHEVSGLDLAGFFDASVRGTGELPLEKNLREFGVDLEFRRSLGSSDKGGTAAKDKAPPAVWLGATLAEQDGKSIFTAVKNGGPVEKAGVAPGDEAVALDGLALTASNQDQRLRGCRDKDRFDLHVFRGDELLKLRIRFESAPEDTAYLVMRDEVDVETEARRAAWLSG